MQCLFSARTLCERTKKRVNSVRFSERKFCLHLIRHICVKMMFVKIVKLKSGKEAYIKSKWSSHTQQDAEADFQICVKDHNTIWTGTKEFADHRSNADYVKLRNVMKSNESSENVTFELNERKLKFHIILKADGDSQAFDELLLKIDVRQIRSDEISSLYLESIQEQSKLLELQARLDEKDSTIASMQSRIDEAIKKAKDYENKLLPSVLMLINSKKEKIRELTEKPVAADLENLRNANSIKMQSSAERFKSTSRNNSRTPEKRRKTAASPAGTPTSSKRLSQGWLTKSRSTPTTSSSLQTKSPPKKRTPQKPAVDFGFNSTRKRPRRICADDSDDYEQGESSKKAASPLEETHSEYTASQILGSVDSYNFTVKPSQCKTFDRIPESSDDDSQTRRSKRTKTSSNESATKSSTSNYQTPDESAQKFNRSSEEIFSQRLTPPSDCDDGANDIIPDSQEEEDSSSKLLKPSKRTKKQPPAAKSVFSVDTQDFI